MEEDNKAKCLLKRVITILYNTLPHRKQLLIENEVEVNEIRRLTCLVFCGAETKLHQPLIQMEKKNERETRGIVKKKKEV